MTQTEIRDTIAAIGILKLEPRMNGLNFGWNIRR
jgi:hypothetical protein